MKVLIALIILCSLSGCSGQVAPVAPASSEEVELLKLRMNDAFAGLEMYAADNSMRYPDSLAVLVPDYLDEIPTDPVSRQDIIYLKTDQGFLLSASGDYSGAGAEPGFPKMNQDGFYVNKDSDFPTVDQARP